MRLPTIELEPHDARMTAGQRGLHPAASQASSTSTDENVIPSTAALTANPSSTVSALRVSDSPSRSFSQFRLFAAGAGLSILSAFITRRAITTKFATIYPKNLPRFTPSNGEIKVNGGGEAAEALGLATLNVFSFSWMLGAGAMWAFDISGQDELRTHLRARMGIPQAPKLGGEVTEQSQDEAEMWMSVVAARMQGKSDQEVAALVAQGVDEETRKREGSTEKL